MKNQFREAIKSNISDSMMADPNSNIQLSIWDKENLLREKADIHRTRLSKYGHSKLNGEMFYREKEGNIFKAFVEEFPDKQPNLEPTVRKIIDQGLGKSVLKGFISSNSDIQQFLVFPIYSNATVLAYVYYGLSIQTLIDLFEADSGSSIYLPDREASSSNIYLHSEKLESLELESGASIVTQLEEDFYAGS